MFTGIVEETGVVDSIQPLDKSMRLTVTMRKCGAGLKVGDSLAINGCCLTVAKLTTKGRKKTAQFDLLNETWQKTNLQFTRAGSLVNLERSLEVGGRLSGHFVTGHIDGMGKIIKWEIVGEDHLLEISAASEVMRYIILKGSIAVDGISLTVESVERESFGIWIIPHTHGVTVRLMPSTAIDPFTIMYLITSLAALISSK
jgi:riboflavin synthase